MRGIPQKIATREDVYNLAMDLPPEQSCEFLDGITQDTHLRLGISYEEFQILRANVLHVRNMEQAAENKLFALKLMTDQAQKDLMAANLERDIAMRRHRTAIKAYDAAKIKYKRLQAQYQEVKNG